MPTPSSLGARGAQLWESVTSSLPDAMEFDERELETLSLAAHQADDLQRLEIVIAEQGAMAVGSTGQPVIHPAIGEARQSRLTISRLLGQLSLPDEDEQPRTEAGKRGQRAARARWNRKAIMEERRLGSA